jgi:hydrogenase assembly chaperone HypC/HupF
LDDPVALRGGAGPSDLARRRTAAHLALLQDRPPRDECVEPETARTRRTAVKLEILIAGIGNIFLGDDGFGRAVAGRIALLSAITSAIWKTWARSPRSSAGSGISKIGVSGVRRNVYITLLDGAGVGHFALTHVGFALSKVDEKEAEETLQTLRRSGSYEA